MWTFSQKPLAESNISFTGKTVLITGANTGLGFEAAVKFTSLGASRVILGVRDLTKGEHAKSLIEERTRAQADVVEVWHLDMNSYDSITDFTTRASQLDRLDVAVLNAGVYCVNYHQSEYGWEETLQVNVLSTALLALLLLSKLRQTPSTSDNGRTTRPVLELVSSRRHEAVTLSEEQKNAENLLEKFNEEATFRSSLQYKFSKLCVMCILDVLASGTKSSEVVITAVCPGFAQSDLSRGHQGIFATILRSVLNMLIMRTTEEGARTLVSGTGLGAAGHGKFWYDDETHEL